MNWDYLQVSESLGDQEPTDVGGEVGQEVGELSARAGGGQGQGQEPPVSAAQSQQSQLKTLG